MSTTRDQLFNILATIHDPEVPVLDIVEMGIVRDAEYDGESVRVDITPTYSGCPAMKAIQDDIVTTLGAHGYPDVLINTVYTPAWTTEWLSDASKQKLKEYGIAPPCRFPHYPISLVMALEQNIACPRCGSTDTEVTSEFGSTPCKALYRCNECSEPFEYFKRI